MATRACDGCGTDVELPVVMGHELTIRFCDDCSAVRIAAEQSAWRALQLGHLLGKAGVTPAMRDWSIETYPSDGEAGRVRGEAKEWLVRHLDGDRSNLVMFGGVGSGKTGLAWSLVRFLVDRKIENAEWPDTPGVPAMLVNWRGFLEDAREAMRFSTHTPRYERARRVPVLVIDDLGAERPTDFAREELANLIEDRYQAQLPVVATSNYEPDKLVVRLGHDDVVVGQRIVSRLTHGATQIRFAAGDRRQEAAA